MAYFLGHTSFNKKLLILTNLPIFIDNFSFHSLLILSGSVAIRTKGNYKTLMSLLNNLMFNWLGQRFGANFDFFLFLPVFVILYVITGRVLDNERSQPLPMEI